MVVSPFLPHRSATADMVAPIFACRFLIYSCTDYNHPLDMLNYIFPKDQLINTEIFLQCYTDKLSQLVKSFSVLNHQGSMEIDAEFSAFACEPYQFVYFLFCLLDPAIPRKLVQLRTRVLPPASTLQLPFLLLPACLGKQTKVNELKDNN